MTIMKNRLRIPGSKTRSEIGTARFSTNNMMLFAIIFGLVSSVVLVRSFAFIPNPNLSGDLNNDNAVNIQDLSILLSNYGTTNAAADINGDGIVSILDLSVLLSNYGRTISAAPTVTLTANPTSVNSGGSSTLSWSSTNATSCSASGAWSGSGLPTSGSFSATNLTATATYTMTCSGPGGSGQSSVTISVTTGGGTSEIAPESACPNQTNASASNAAQVTAMICMTNYARNANGGLAPLTANSALTSAAQAKNNDIMTCNEFSHTACGRPFDYWILFYGFQGQCYGENIAYGYPTVRATFIAWMNSAGHRANILNPSYRNVGEALSIWNGQPLWTTDFGC